jgi:hypothetical protein
MPRLAVLAVLTCLIAAAPAGAAPQPRLPVPGHQDVNGDGRDDIVFGILDPHIFTVFGKTDRAFVDVRTPGVWGQRIDGPFGDLPAANVVGDVNGDGRADIRTAEPSTLDVLVLAGRSESGAIDSGPAAVRLRNAYDARGIGDVNGDGLDDLVVKAERRTASRRNDVIGVVFGSRTPRTLDVAKGQVSVRLRLPAGPRGNRRDYPVDGVGDVNGDGIGDLAIGASFYPLRTCHRARGVSRICDGRVWVLSGRRSWPARVDVTRPGRRGFDVRPRTSEGRFFWTAGATAAGDLDGDGYDDMLVDVTEALTSTRVVVWGSRHLGRHRRISRRSSRIRDEHIHGIYPVADFDGDGRADLLASPDVGPTEDFPDQRLRTFLLRGRHWTGVRTKRPRRARDGHVLFRQVEGASLSGDVNGDGRADVFVPPLRDPRGWVAFGDPSTAAVHVNSPGFRGFAFGTP